MARIIVAVFLPLIKPLSVSFYIIYLLCGISDILDGYVARKTNTVSKLGAILDSVADFIFVVVMLIIFVPMLLLEWWQIYWISIIALTRCVSLLIGFIKYHALTFLHTHTNKFTGLILFCFPLLYHVAGINITTIIICGIASLSALEELIINATSKKLKRDVRGLYENK